MTENLSKEEKKLLESILKEHRIIMSKTGYGKIHINYNQKNDKQLITVVADTTRHTEIKFG